MSKKSLFEKLGLIESDEDKFEEEPELEVVSEITNPEPCTLIEPAAVGSEDVVSVTDTYSLNGLENMENTVYKVKDMIAALPKEMPDSTKQVTIRGMMSVVGLSYDEIEEDAIIRVKTLDSAFSSKIEGLKTEQEENNAKIESLKQEIEKLTIRNSQISDAVNKNLDTIHAEVEEIQYVLDYIKGGNEQ